MRGPGTQVARAVSVDVVGIFDERGQTVANLLFASLAVFAQAGGGAPAQGQGGGGMAQFFLTFILPIFLIFYFLVFSGLVVKHTERIRARSEQRLPFWNFFDTSSYVVMAIMMTGGMWLRLARVVPNWMIAFFYSGLGTALFSCGVRFLSAFSRKDVLMGKEEQAISGEEPD